MTKTIRFGNGCALSIGSIQMKTYMHGLFLTIGGASVLLMTGCRAISTTHTQDIGGPRFTPSDPAKIEILQDVPARPHVEVGKVWGHSFDTSVDVSKLEDALRVEASRLGADAIVVWQNRIDAGDSTISRPVRLGAPERTVIGAAIKYP